MISMEEKKEVLREHLEDCLKHFGKWFNSKVPRRSRGRTEAMKPMAEFLGVTPGTVQRMLDDMSPLPRGETHIKLLCYLDLHGYKIIEFERMPKIRRNFSELIGFELLSPVEASNLVGYHDTQQIYQAIFGREGVNKKRENLMWTIWKEKRVELERRKKDAYDTLRLEVLFSVPLEVGSVSVAVQQLVLSASQPVITNAGMRLAVLNILENSVLLFEDSLFDSLSDSELCEFSQPILRLSSHLSTLSSKILTRKVG